MRTKEKIFTIKGKSFKKFIDKKQIKAIVKELARKINSDYIGKKPLFIAILKGSLFFVSDLLRALKIECELETISAKSYGMKMSSSGSISISTNHVDVKGRDVIIIDDIVDSGLTMKKLMDILSRQEPASLEAVAFLSKPSERKVDVKVKYIGIEIPSDFVIGYGLDYAEQGRQLADIYVVSE